MLWYVILFMFCVANWVLISNIKDKKAKCVFELFVVLILAMFAGTRYRIGGYDYLVYERLFNSVSKPSLYSIGEIFTYGSDFLYYFYNSIIKAMGFNFYGFTLIESLIFHLLLYRGIKKNNIDFGFFIIIFLYKLFIFNTFVSLRQSLVLVIFFNSIPLLKEKKKIKYLIIISLCSFLHSSSIILFPLVFVDKINFSKKGLILYSSVFFLLFLFNISGLYKFNPSDLISSIFSGNASIINKIEAYSTNTSSVNVLSTIETYIITILIILFYEKVYNGKNNNKLMLNIFLLVIPFVTFFRSFEIVIRFRDYFTIAFPFAIYYIIQAFKNKEKLILYFIVTCLCFAGYYRYLYSYDHGAFLPYKSFIFENVSIFSE